MHGRSKCTDLFRQWCILFYTYCIKQQSMYMCVPVQRLERMNVTTFVCYQLLGLMHQNTDSMRNFSKTKCCFGFQQTSIQTNNKKREFFFLLLSSNRHQIKMHSSVIESIVQTWPPAIDAFRCALLWLGKRIKCISYLDLLCR